MTHPPEPTSEQCSAGEILTHENRRYLATWYPQMGGYGSHCLVDLGINETKEDRCFNVLVWHDGEFPFSDSEPPKELHHCVASQFIRFGETVANALKETTAKTIKLPNGDTYYWDPSAGPGDGSIQVYGVARGAYVKEANP